MKRYEVGRLPKLVYTTDDDCNVLRLIAERDCHEHHFAIEETEILHSYSGTMDATTKNGPCKQTYVLGLRTLYPESEVRNLTEKRQVRKRAKRRIIKRSRITRGNPDYRTNPMP